MKFFIFELTASFVTIIMGIFLLFVPKTRLASQVHRAIVWMIAILLCLFLLIYKGINGRGIEDDVGIFLAKSICYVYSFEYCTTQESKDAQNSNDFKAPDARTSCQNYKKIMASIGKPNAVACNDATADGFYWAVSAPRIRPWGYWGVKGVEGVPSCNSEKDIGKRAETATFNTSTEMWDVHNYYCRNELQHKECTSKNAEGPEYISNNYFDGIFLAICRKQ